ncbi:MAG: hypothetical protein IJK58_08665 [Clostridia bacterium]|nr:hypothetical protein [Clostridia bacterium]
MTDYNSSQAPRPPQKKAYGWLVAYIATVLVLATAAVLLFVAPGFLRSDKALPEKDEDTTDVVTAIETETEKPETEPETETETETETKTETDRPADNEPDFEKYGIRCEMKLGRPVDFTVPCNDDETKFTTGTITVNNVSRKDINDSIIEFAEENNIYVGGYEIISVEMELIFNDDNAIEYGINPHGRYEDYYNIDLLDDTSERFVDTYDDTYVRYEIEYEGERQYVYMWSFTENTSETSIDAIVTRTYLVPKGYDGLVIGYADMSDLSETEAEGHLYEYCDKIDYCLFRIK